MMVHNLELVHINELHRKLLKKKQNTVIKKCPVQKYTHLFPVSIMHI